MNQKLVLSLSLSYSLPLSQSITVPFEYISKSSEKKKNFSLCLMISVAKCWGWRRAAVLTIVVDKQASEGVGPVGGWWGAVSQARSEEAWLHK